VVVGKVVEEDNLMVEINKEEMIEENMIIGIINIKIINIEEMGKIINMEEMIGISNRKGMISIKEIIEIIEILKMKEKTDLNDLIDMRDMINFREQTETIMMNITKDMIETMIEEITIAETMIEKIKIMIEKDIRIEEILMKESKQ
jgi:hypothetical protein